jgi:hypothetical protein
MALEQERLDHHFVVAKQENMMIRYHKTVKIVQSNVHHVKIHLQTVLPAIVIEDKE